MAYASTIRMVQGDNLPGVQFTIKDRNNAAAGQYLDKKDSSTWANVDLTSATILAVIRLLGSTEPIDTFSLEILEPASGQVLMSLANTTFQNTPGSYEMEVTVNYGASGKQTVYDWLRFDVGERFA